MSETSSTTVGPTQTLLQVVHQQQQNTTTTGAALTNVQHEHVQHLKRLEENKSLYKTVLKFVAGGLSAGFVSGIMNSPDHVKTRMQLTQAKTSFSRAYMNLFREEGFRVLVGRGLFAAVVREQFYSSVRMGLYDPLKSFISSVTQSNSHGDVGLLTKILSGAISGSLGSIVSNGCDLVKIRQQGFVATATKTVPDNWVTIVTNIVKHEGGIWGLFRGSTPNVLRASILTATQLSTYDHTKHLLLKTPYFQDNIYTHVTASLVAGLLSTITTNPSDVLKTKLMASKGKDQYSGLIDCAIKTYQTHGVKAFASGFVPNYIRIGTHCLLTLPLYEEIRKLMGLSTV